jgi:hypothetical protein
MRSASPRPNPAYATGTGPTPAVLALPRDVRPEAQSGSSLFPAHIVIPGAPGRPGTKVPIAE